MSTKKVEARPNGNRWIEENHIEHGKTQTNPEDWEQSK